MQDKSCGCRLEQSSYYSNIRFKKVKKAPCTHALRLRDARGRAHTPSRAATRAIRSERIRSRPISRTGPLVARAQPESKSGLTASSAHAALTACWEWSRACARPSPPAKGARFDIMIVLVSLYAAGVELLTIVRSARRRSSAHKRGDSHCTPARDAAPPQSLHAGRALNISCIRARAAGPRALV